MGGVGFLPNTNIDEDNGHNARCVCSELENKTNCCTRRKEAIIMIHDGMSFLQGLKIRRIDTRH
jgi:hypothetical protein